MRCAVVLGDGRELAGSVEDGPRLEFLEIAAATNADVLHYGTAADRRGLWFRTVFDRSKKIGSAVNVAMLASRYDRLYVTAEGVGLPLALLLKARGWQGKMTCVFHNMGSRSKQRTVAFLGHKMFSALITVSKDQADILVDACKMPRNKVRAVFNWVDDEFFYREPQPKQSLSGQFMACGAENRDYDTLARAARRVEGAFRIYGHGYRANNIAAQSTPPNLTYMPRVSYPDLRDAYMNSGIVIVPLNDVDYAAGVTGLVEAMAAGRAIVVTSSRGIRDYIAGFDPVTVVPAGDEEALANALTRLDADPERKRTLGRINREFAIEKCSTRKYAQMISALMLAE